MQFVHDCVRCKEKKLTKSYGCKKVFKYKEVRAIECFCGGNKNCDVCKGENRFSLHTCPRNIVCNLAINRIVPYFYDYILDGYKYPCGNRYITPKILIQTFELLLAIYNDEKRKTIPKD